MGQVSLLEDIQQALENLAALSEWKPSFPSEIQISAQEKRLAREQERIHGVARQLEGLARLIKNRASKGEVFKYLNIQQEQSTLRAINAKKQEASHSLKLIQERYGKIDAVVKESERRRLQVLAAEVQNNCLKKTLEKSDIPAESISKAIKQISRISAGNIESLANEKHINKISDLERKNKMLERENATYRSACKNMEEKIKALEQALLAKR